MLVDLIGEHEKKNLFDFENAQYQAAVDYLGFSIEDESLALFYFKFVLYSRIQLYYASCRLIFES